MVNLDLGCGDNKKEGYIGVDKFKTSSTDIEADLFSFPWPFEDDYADDIHCSHFFEHVPKEIRGRFMEEVYRVLKKGCKATFITPLGDRCFQDATHEWPMIVAGSYLYFNKKWREDNKLQHGYYDLKCDFDYTYGFSLSPSVQVRSADFQAFAVAHYNNAASDLYATLTKR